MGKAKERVLVTGSAGFIGHHLMLALAAQGYALVGLDSISDYYDPELKYHRLQHQGIDRGLITYNRCVPSSTCPTLSFTQLDITDQDALEHLFREQQFDLVIHLAAQPGIRHSITHPQPYVASNLVGFANILECCRRHPIRHLLFASSSSVYGLNEEMPFKTTHATDCPISFYAATKKANEVMAHSYAHIHRIPTTGMRFFTVYGPMGRPDMACYSFAKNIVEGEPIKLFNYGDMRRDFTYVDDVTESIVRLLPIYPDSTNNSSTTNAPFKIYNIGNNTPENLLEFVGILERLLQKKAMLDLRPIEPGDVPVTYADVSDLMETVNFSPNTPLAAGLKRFVDWFKPYYEQHYARA